MNLNSRLAKIERLAAGARATGTIPLITSDVSARDAAAIYTAEIRAPFNPGTLPQIDPNGAAQLYREICG